MASEPATAAPPPYPQDVPSYSAIALADGTATSSTVLARGPPASSGDSKHPHKFYFQAEQKFPARQSLITTFAEDPTLCRPVYTVKHHGQQRMSLTGPSSPDITVYRGADSNGQVVATATIKSSTFGKGIGEVKTFGASVETMALRNEKGRAVWNWGGRQLAWNVAVQMKPPANAAEHELGLPPDPNKPKDTSVKGKFKAAMDVKPKILFASYTGVLESEPGVELAVYHDISPHNPPMTRQLIYKDGHVAILEFKDAFVEPAFQDAALVMLVLMIERAKRGVANGKGGIGYTFNPWGG